MAAKTTDKDLGEKQILKSLDDIKKSWVKIGVNEGAGTYEDGTEVVSVAFWNEFGTKKIPSRPFIRATVDEKKSKFESFRDKLLDLILKGKETVDHGLNRLGFEIEQAIKLKIKQGPWEPNKGSSKMTKKQFGEKQRKVMSTEGLTGYAARKLKAVGHVKPLIYSGKLSEHSITHIIGKD